MQPTGYTHVSIYATDINKSAMFYQDLFNVEQVPAPNFGSLPVIWLRIGDQQLHLFERDIDAPQYHHFGIAINDFNEFYFQAKERDLFLDDDDPMGNEIYELPDGSVQVYIRDLDRNLLEVNYPDVTELNAEIQDRIVKREDQFPQSEENLKGTLFPTEETSSIE